MTARVDISALAPATYKALVHLDTAVQRNTDAIPKPLLELLRLRASQLNGCAYCVDMHSSDAHAAGEPDARIYAVAAWREGPFFTDAERAALALAEAMTRLTDPGDRVSDEVWAEAGKHFDDTALAALVMAIATLNAWNRVCVATRMVPESFHPAAT